jgi:putative MATE family efflux protein
MQAAMQSSPATPRSKWSLLKEALSGTQQDFTQGSLTRGITLLAIPTVLEMGMEATFGLVDAFWVAKLGANAIAAVGLTESIIILLFSVALGLAMAATATVARRVGEKDADGASIAAFQAILIGVAVSIVTGIFGALYAPTWLRLMHAEPGVIATGSRYTAILLGGNASIMLIFLINGVFRGSGDAVYAMRTLWLANLINLILDPCLIYGWGPFPRLGVAGAAVATTTGRSIGVLFQLWVLLGGRARVAILRRHLRLDWSVMRRMLRTGGTAMIQYFIATASWISLARINAIFGSAAVAGYTMALRIILFAILPSWGICSAAATLVGQNLGAKRPERSERAVWLAGFYNMVFLTFVGLLLFTCGPLVAGLFTNDTQVLGYAAECLKFVSLGYPFYAWGMTMEQAFNGAGDTVTPTWINLFCYWMLQIPFAWTISQHTSLGTRGVYLAICSAESVLAVVGIILFRRGRWKEVRI